MARDRFFEIHRYLHFLDISTTPLPTDENYDRLNRIRKILTLIEERFVALYHPHCQCTVDEAMVPYKQWRSQSKCVDQALHDGEKNGAGSALIFFDHGLFSCHYTHFLASFLNLLRSFFKTVNLPPLYNCTGLPFVCSA